MAAEHRRSVVYAQNFLRDPRLVERLVRRAGIGPGDLVLEIGPGAGIITSCLAVCAGGVIAIEKDPLLAARLQRRFAGRPHVAIQAADALTVPLPGEPYRVFASIPFNRTAAIVGKLTSGVSPPEDAFLVLPAEAAARYLGRPEETLAALLLKPWFEPTVFHRFRRSDFVPQPAVEVLLLRLRGRGRPLVCDADATLYRDFVVHCFTARRPGLEPVLAALFGRNRLRRICRGLAIDPAGRLGLLPFERWLALFHAFRDWAGPAAHGAVLGAQQRLRHQQARLQKHHRTRVAAPPVPHVAERRRPGTPGSAPPHAPRRSAPPWARVAGREKMPASRGAGLGARGR